MKRIKEITSSKGNYYEVYLDQVKIDTVKITRVKKEKDGLTYFILFDSKWKVIDEVYRYLNYNCMNEPINVREQMANALKILYSYKEIVNKEFQDFDMKDFKSLSNLILGIGIEKDHHENSYIVSRGRSTHDIYFYNIRRFYKCLHIKNEVLFEQRIVNNLNSGYGFLAHTKRVTVKKYTINKGDARRSRVFIPKYISLKEYKQIIKYTTEMASRNSLRNRIMIDLMYTTGMRLGEVLGLTLEDIQRNIDNQKYGTLYIRNRVTDKSYQNAKSCFKVNNICDYETLSYKTENDGYQLINIAPRLFELIQEYIDESRSVLDVSEIVMNNITSCSRADTVDGKKENQYLFLNKDGGPLSSSGWNKFLKSVFTSVGIIIDRGIKKNNLSHRFRHGYAMYLIDEEGRSIEYVKDKMRHRSLQSTLIYYNPTEEDKLKDTMIIEDSIREKLKEN
ncbi:tyrosine-type recombinase/integrase [Clostridium akagii]|uniref:tyrosine-type recombinase/integrase n=1 Tax=Clostridium akagii TaxID=91623 RepID=UPI00047D803E|nr:site-specific integrase [Clostridium akagii]